MGLRRPGEMYMKDQKQWKQVGKQVAMSLSWWTLDGTAGGEGKEEGRWATFFVVLVNG